MGGNGSKPDNRTETQKRLDANKIPSFLGPYFEDRRLYTGTKILPWQMIGSTNQNIMLPAAGGITQVTDLDTLWTRYRDTTALTDENDKIKQLYFNKLIEYLDKVGQDYKHGIEKYIKEMDYVTNQELNANVQLDANGNIRYQEGTYNPMYWDYTPKYPEYLEIKKAVPDIYDLFKGALGDSRSILIPSILWVNIGVPLKYSKDTPNPIPDGGVPIVLKLQHLFEENIYNSELSASWSRYFHYQIANIDSAIDREKMYRTTTQLDNELQPEFERQKAAHTILHVLKDDKKGYNQYPVTDTSTFAAWKPTFVKSVEYKDFLRKKAQKDQEQLDLDAQQYGFATETHIDVDKLAAEKDFYAGDLFEEEDVDSINYDLIQTLKKQESMYNETLRTLRAQYKQSEDDLKKKLDAAYEAFRKKIEDAKEQNFKEIDAAVKTNTENIAKRQKQAEQKKLDAATEVSEDSALASLTNYQGCNSVQKPKHTYEDIKDIDIQDLINKQAQQFATGSGRKRLSLSEQMRLINKLYAEYYNDEKPYSVSNSARKVGGEVNTEDVLTGVDSTAMALGLLAIAAPFPVDIVCGIISGFLSLFSFLWGKSKAEEEEERRKEEERQQGIFEDWKNDTMETTISVLEAEVDEDKYESRKEQMIQRMLNTAKYEITDEEIANLEKQIDAAHEQTMKTRQDVLDTISENTKQIIQINAGLIEDNQNNLRQIMNDNSDNKKKLIDDYLEEAKERTQGFLDADAQRKLDEVKEQEINKNIAQKVQEKTQALEEQAKTISQLKGVSDCSLDYKSKDQMKKEAVDELKKQQEENDEAIARGEKPPNPPPEPAPATGSGIRRRKNNKKSIANQIYLMNRRFIETF